MTTENLLDEGMRVQRRYGTHPTTREPYDFLDVGREMFDDPETAVRVAALLCAWAVDRAGRNDAETNRLELLFDKTARAYFRSGAMLRLNTQKEEPK